MTFDRYTFQARVLPMYTALLPLATAIVLLYPGYSPLQLVGALTVVPAALAMLVSQLGRDIGSRKQPVLWRSWGGAPTTQLLRHSNPLVNSQTRNRYHDVLRRLRPDLAVPTKEQEDHDQHMADEVYETYTQYLRGQTRDQSKFPLLHKENISYGFRRNLWGLKPLGIFTSSIGCVVVALKLRTYWPNPSSIPAEVTVGGALVFIMLTVWVFWITPSWVRIAAEAYARQLFEATEGL